MKKTIIDILDFVNGIIVIFGAIGGIALMLSKLFNYDEKAFILPAILLFGRFILKMSQKNTEQH